MSFIVDQPSDLIGLLDNFPGTYEISRKKKRSETAYEGCNESDFSVLMHDQRGFPGFRATIRCDFGGDTHTSYKEICAKWIKRLGDLTGTSWIVDQNFGSRKRESVKYLTEQLTLHSERYLCKLSSQNKLAPEDRKGVTKVIHNHNCGASITFKFHKISKGLKRWCSDGYYLNRPVPLNGEIDMHWVHSHALGPHSPWPIRNKSIISPQKTTFMPTNFPVRSKEDLKELLKQINDNFEFVGEVASRKYTVEDGFRLLQGEGKPGFHAKIKCCLKPENWQGESFDYKAAFQDWINKFSRLTCTNWIVRAGGTKPSGARVVASTGNQDGHYLRRARPLDVEIVINFQHTHQLHTHMDITPLKWDREAKEQSYQQDEDRLTDPESYVADDSDVSLSPSPQPQPTLSMQRAITKALKSFEYLIRKYYANKNDASLVRTLERFAEVNTSHSIPSVEVLDMHIGQYNNARQFFINQYTTLARRKRKLEQMSS